MQYVRTSAWTWFFESWKYFKVQMLPGSGREMSLAPFSSQNQRLSKRHQYQSFGTIVLISAAEKMKNTKKCEAIKQNIQ